jgi:hypothetical protein
MTRKLAGYSFQALLHLVSVTLQLPLIAVKASTYRPDESLEKICSAELSAARRSLGVSKHWILVFERILETVPDTYHLMQVLTKQAQAPAECAVIRFE